ncbi:MAG: 50S ribosomal protein L25 [Patescibacteria group bacterium]
MDDLQIKANPREESWKGDQIPAVTYGKGVENQNLVLEKKEFLSVYKEAGESTLIDLIVKGKEPVKVILKEVQRDRVTDDIIHVDFYQVRMDEEITAEIEFVFSGEPPAEKEMGGVFVTNKAKLQIKCLPQYLIKEIKIDVSSLKTFEDSIKIKDVNIPENIEVLDDIEEIICLVTPPRSEEELKELEEKPEDTVSDVEKIGEKEGEEDGEKEGEDSATPEASQESSESEKKEEKK